VPWICRYGVRLGIAVRLVGADDDGLCQADGIGTSITAIETDPTRSDTPTAQQTPRQPAIRPGVSNGRLTRGQNPDHSQRQSNPNVKTSLQRQDSTPDSTRRDRITTVGYILDTVGYVLDRFVTCG
jgi:hypothetical protein